MEEVDKYKYLGVTINVDGGFGKEVTNILMEGMYEYPG